MEANNRQYNKNMLRFLLLSIMCLVQIMGQAQENRSKQSWTAKQSAQYRHEVVLQLGIGSTIDRGKLYDRFYDRLCGHFEIESDATCFHLGPTATSAQYYYHPLPGLGVGGSVGYAKGVKGMDQYFVTLDDGTRCYDRDKFTPYYGDLHARSFYVMPAVKYDWLDFRFVRFYVKGALGVQHLKYEFRDKDNSPQGHQFDEDGWRLAGQITPLGVSIGSRMVRLFFELGYGVEGTFNMGLSLNFYKR